MQLEFTAVELTEMLRPHLGFEADKREMAAIIVIAVVVAEEGNSEAVGATHT